MNKRQHKLKDMAERGDLLFQRNIERQAQLVNAVEIKRQTAGALAALGWWDAFRMPPRGLGFGFADSPLDKPS